MVARDRLITQPRLSGEWRDRSAIPDLLLWGAGSYRGLRARIQELGCSRVLLLTSGTLRAKTPWVERVRDLLGDLVVGVRSDSQQFTPDWLCFDTANLARPLRPKFPHGFRVNLLIRGTLSGMRTSRYWQQL